MDTYNGGKVKQLGVKKREGNKDKRKKGNRKRGNAEVIENKNALKAIPPNIRYSNFGGLTRIKQKFQINKLRNTFINPFNPPPIRPTSV